MAAPWGHVVRISAEPGAIEERVPLSGDEISIGRRMRCNVVCEHDAVSAVHCRLYRMLGPNGSPEFELEDCSTNGTYVNGARIGKGRKIKIGDQETILLTKPKRPGPPVCFRFEVEQGRDVVDSGAQGCPTGANASSMPCQSAVPTSPLEVAEGAAVPVPVAQPASVAARATPPGAVLAPAQPATPSIITAASAITAPVTPATEPRILEAASTAHAVSSAPPRAVCGDLTNVQTGFSRLDEEEARAKTVLAECGRKRALLGQEARSEAREVHEARTQLEACRRQLEEQLAAQRRSNDQLERGCRVAEAEATRERAECERLQAQLSEENARVEKLEGTVATLREQAVSAETHARDATSKLQEAESRCARLQAQCEEALADKECASRKAEDLRGRLAERDRALITLGQAAREATRELRKRAEALEGVLSEACLGALGSTQAGGEESAADCQADEATQRVGPIADAAKRIPTLQAERASRLASTAPWDPVKEEIVRNERSEEPGAKRQRRSLLRSLTPPREVHNSPHG